MMAEIGEEMMTEIIELNRPEMEELQMEEFKEEIEVTSTEETNEEVIEEKPNEEVIESN